MERGKHVRGGEDMLFQERCELSVEAGSFFFGSGKLVLREAESSFLGAGNQLLGGERLLVCGRTLWTGGGSRRCSGEGKDVTDSRVRTLKLSG